MKNSDTPKIKFIYSPSADTKSVVKLILPPRSKNKIHFAKRFLPEYLRFVLERDFTAKEKKKILENYVSDYYKRRGRDLKDRFGATQSDWKKVEKQYYGLVAELFKNRPWPKGDYYGFGTIFWCYPRIIQKKTFLFPLNHPVPHFANKVIAHEMLHFMFFDDVRKRYGLKEGAKVRGKEPDHLWKVSEAFNNIVEEWPPYRKVFPFESLPYLETEKIYQKMKKEWQHHQDIDILLDKFLT